MRGLQACTSDPAWVLLPVAATDVDLRLVGGGRLIECLRRDGQHALCFVKTNTPQTFFLPAKLGFADGAWQVLR
jgi:hypothetical protein